MDKRLSLLLINTDAKTHAAMKNFQNSTIGKNIVASSYTKYENKQMKFPFGLRESRFNNFIYKLNNSTLELTGNLVKKNRRPDSIDNFESFYDNKQNRSYVEENCRSGIRISAKATIENLNTSRVVNPKTIEVSNEIISLEIADEHD